MPKSTPREDAALKKLDANPNAPRYVQCDLTAEQKKVFATFMEESEITDFIQWIDQTVGNNYTLSMKSLDVGYQCSLTGTAKQSGNANVCLISRASSPSKAAWSVYYKATQILPLIWPVSNRLEDLDA